MEIKQLKEEIEDFFKQYDAASQTESEFTPADTVKCLTSVGLALVMLLEMTININNKLDMIFIESLPNGEMAKG
jgi:hypothetical protein